MSIKTSYSRISHHAISTPGGTFSIPPQEDFTLTGTSSAWNPNGNQLVDREIGINTIDKKVYIRIGNTIKEIQTNVGATLSNYFVNTGTSIKLDPSFTGYPLTSPISGSNDLGSTSVRWNGLYIADKIDSVTSIPIISAGVTSSIIKSSGIGLPIDNSISSIGASNSVTLYDSGIPSLSIISRTMSLYLQAGNNINLQSSNDISIQSPTGTTNINSLTSSINSGFLLLNTTNTTFILSNRLLYQVNQIEHQQQTVLFQSTGKISRIKDLITTNATITQIANISLTYSQTIAIDAVIQAKGSTSSLVYGSNIFAVYKMNSLGIVSLVGTIDQSTKSEFIGVVSTPDIDPGIGIKLNVSGTASNMIWWTARYNYSIIQ